MKCPKCMEKRILDDVPVKNLCPKCGSEMIDDFLDNPADDPEPVYLAHICLECGHEEKVGGGKP